MYPSVPFFLEEERVSSSASLAPAYGIKLGRFQVKALQQYRPYINTAYF